MIIGYVLAASFVGALCWAFLRAQADRAEAAARMYKAALEAHRTNLNPQEIGD